jgi:hypothetical protein
MFLMLFTSWQTARREEGRDGGLCVTFKVIPPITYFLWLVPPPKVSIISQNSITSWGLGI